MVELTALDYILDGLEAELALERELGVRSVEIDRNLLATVAATGGASGASGAGGASGTSGASGDSGAIPARPPSPAVRPPAGQSNNPNNSNNQTIFDFVFLHDRPLSAKGVEMLAKIVIALGKTAETAPLVVAPPVPEARVYVFLGAKALAKYQPDLRLAENSWGKSAKGSDLLLVKSPEEIVRFATVTPTLQKIKQDMWRSLKGLRQRFG